MANRIAVAVIHGMGSQGEVRPPIDKLTFSAGLYSELKQEFGDTFDQRVAWREVFWSDILQNRQESFIASSLTGKARWMKTRRFIMHNLADAACYRNISNSNAFVYQAVHQRVAETIARLQQLAGPSTPLLVLAHSLGGHIMSNYIWDMQRGNSVVPVAGDFQNLRTMAGLVTFGCNMPIFTFAFHSADVTPIDRPGANIPVAKQLTPWWLNFNDKDDALGMPLGDTSPQYHALETSNQLKDRWINSGRLWEFWNPLSHNTYWTDRDFYRPVAAFMRKALKIGPV